MNSHRLPLLRWLGLLAAILLLAAAPADATLLGWGGNLHLELAAGYRSDMEALPVPVEGLPAVREVAAGEGADAALDTEGCVWTWGGNIYGQLGTGVPSRPFAIPVRVLCGVTQITAGGNDVAALLTDGTVDVWGSNLAGEAGNGTTTGGKEVKGMAIYAPQPVPGLTGVTRITGGGDLFAVRADGSVVAWGINVRGQLGLGFKSFNVTRPTLVPGLSGPVAISTAPHWVYAGLTLALLPTGQVLAAGNGSLGELGPALTDRYSFAPIAGLPPVTQIAAGPINGYARTPDHRLYAWGADKAGELGLPPGKQQACPVKTVTQPCAPTPELLPFPASLVAAGTIGYAAAISEGRVLAWGVNEQGNLGNGTRHTTAVPTAVPGLSEATSLTLGSRHMFADATSTPPATRWLTATVTAGHVGLSWVSPPTIEKWHVQWIEDVPGGLRRGAVTLAASARAYTVTGLHAGRWLVFVQDKVWPHPRVASVTVTLAHHRR